MSLFLNKIMLLYSRDKKKRYSVKINNKNYAAAFFSASI